MRLTSEETQQAIADYDMMTNFPKTSRHNKTIYRIQRRTKWASKKVFVLTPYAAQSEPIDFSKWVKPIGAEMVTKTDFDNEEHNRLVYTRGLNISLSIELDNKITASHATDAPVAE